MDISETVTAVIAIIAGTIMFFLMLLFVIMIILAPFIGIWLIIKAF